MQCFMSIRQLTSGKSQDNHSDIVSSIAELLNKCQHLLASYILLREKKKVLQANLIGALYCGPKHFQLILSFSRKGHPT